MATKVDLFFNPYPVSKVESPHKRHRVQNLANKPLSSPEKRIIAEKGTHTVIGAWKPSPLKDAQKIREGKATLEITNKGRRLFTVQSESNPYEERSYKEHADPNSSKKIIPDVVLGSTSQTKFLPMNGKSLVEEVTNFHNDVENKSGHALFKKLEERYKLDQLHQKLKESKKTEQKTEEKSASKPLIPHTVVQKRKNSLTANNQTVIKKPKPNTETPQPVQTSSPKETSQLSLYPEEMVEKRSDGKMHVIEQK